MVFTSVCVDGKLEWPWVASACCMNVIQKGKCFLQKLFLDFCSCHQYCELPTQRKWINVSLKDPWKIHCLVTVIWLLWIVTVLVSNKLSSHSYYFQTMLYAMCFDPQDFRFMFKISKCGNGPTKSSIQPSSW